MGCNQSTATTGEHTDRNVRTSNNKRLVFGMKFGKGDQGGVEVKLSGGYESGFRRVYDEAGKGYVKNARGTDELVQTAGE